MGAFDAPLTLLDRLSYIRWLYPKYNIVSCKDKHCESALQILMWLYRKHSDCKLKIHAGYGTKGVVENNGGNAESFVRLMETYNNQTFHDSKELRMKWLDWEINKQERGEISGTFVRNLALKLDPYKNEDVDKFKIYLHSRINHHEAWNILRFLKMTK